jgi:hypothetical protein
MEFLFLLFFLNQNKFLFKSVCFRFIYENNIQQKTSLNSEK